MHECLNCGKKFEGKFCPECGTKWVDPDTCPKCGAHHDADAKFCTECGARLDGKVACPNCGALIEGTASFCAECGTKLGVQQIEKSEVATRSKAQSVLALSGVICLILSALMGLVFTFVTGVSLVNTESGRVMETGMLYDFFGEVYKDIDSTRETLEQLFRWRDIGEQREFALYFPAVLGTAVSAVGIIGVVALFGLTAANAYKKFYIKKEANIIAPAVATYLVFATMATLLLALVAMNGAGEKAAFSAPTLAGLITGGVFLGLGVVLIACSNYKAFAGFNASTGAIFAVAVSALTAVVIALVTLPSVGVEFDLSKYFSDYSTNLFDYKTKVSYSLFSGMQAILMLFKDDDTVTRIVAYSTVGGVAAFALGVIAAVVLYKKVSAVSNGKNRGTLVLSAVAVALAAVYLAFSIVSVDAVIDAIWELIGDGDVDEYGELIKTAYTVPIATLVITTLAFVAEVASKFIRKKQPVEIENN